MCPVPIQELLEGCAPAIGRTLSTGALAKGDVKTDQDSAAETHISARLGRQVQNELADVARDALHCKICDKWLRAPLTLSCGHSICSVHTQGSDGSAVRCPTCGINDDNPVRDFLLQECVEQFAPERKPAHDDERPRKRAKVQSNTNNRKGASERAKSAVSIVQRIYTTIPKGVHCSVCLETFPLPYRAPAVLCCGHALCTSCVAGICSKGQKHRCPLCKTSMTSDVRPSHALTSAVRFLNALPVAQRVRGLGESIEDLRDCQQRVQSHKRKQAVALAVPLHEAIRQGNFSVVDELILQGADCNTLVNGYSALHAAARSRSFGLIGVLLKHGADPAAQTAVSQDSALLMACAAEVSLQSDPARLQAIRDMLLALDQDTACCTVRMANAAGATPLLHITQRLLQTSAGLFSGDSFEKELEIAKLLMGYGAELDARDIFGQSPAQLLFNLNREHGLI